MPAESYDEAKCTKRSAHARWKPEITRVQWVEPTDGRGTSVCGEDRVCAVALGPRARPERGLMCC